MPEEDIDLFDAINASDIPDEEKGILVAKLIEVAQSMVLTEILEIFSPEQKNQLDQIAEDGSNEDLEDFIDQNVPDYDERFRRAVLSLKRDLIKALA